MVRKTWTGAKIKKKNKKKATEAVGGAFGAGPCAHPPTPGLPALRGRAAAAMLNASNASQPADRRLLVRAPSCSLSSSFFFFFFGFGCFL